MTQTQIIEDLLVNHSYIFMKHLSLYQQSKQRPFLETEAVNLVLNELEHYTLSDYVVLKAFNKLEQSLSLEKIYHERKRA